MRRGDFRGKKEIGRHQARRNYATRVAINPATMDLSVLPQGVKARAGAGSTEAKRRKGEEEKKKVGDH